jgi:tetratricopeptide (TPR) repeat protein
MPDVTAVETILTEAKDLERKYDWLGAAQFYEKASASLSEQDFLAKGNISEHKGYALFRAAMQAESPDEFKERMRRCAANYEKAKESYSKIESVKKAWMMLRCDAMIAYASYWLAPNAAEKKKSIDGCWELAHMILETLAETNEPVEYGKTYNQLVDAAFFAFFLEWSFQAREKIIRKAVELGEHAINFLSTGKDNDELARAYAKEAVCMSVVAYNFLDFDEREGYYQKALAHWQRAKELDEDTAILEVLHPFFGPYIIFGVEGTDQAIANFQKALDIAKNTKDRFLIGSALDWLTYHTAWKGQHLEDPDKLRESAKTSEEYGRASRQAYSRLSFISPRADFAWVEAVAHPVSFLSRSVVETDPVKKRNFLRQVIDVMPELLKIAEDSGYPEAVFFAQGSFGSLLTSLSKMEDNADEKKKLLDEALKHRNEVTSVTEQIQPFMYWNRGVAHGALSEIKSELAYLTSDLETKKSILQQAVLDRQMNLELCRKDLAFYESKGESPALIDAVASTQSNYANLLNRLYELTKNKDDLEKALEAYQGAATLFQKSNFMSRAAECYWKKAQIYDDVAKRLKSAENFELASACYAKAAEKIPQLKTLYAEYALYMQAWSEIEKARQCHRKQEYDSAVSHFEKAAELHKSATHWSYLTTNYLAWAQVERAEDVSRKEQTDESHHMFGQAAQLFTRAGESIQAHLSEIENPDEKQMAGELLKSTDWRKRYCLARSDLEEAKTLDKKGDHCTSAEKYGSAAEGFEKVGILLKSKGEQDELRFLVYLSQAWQKMMLAEAEASPELLIEASEFFEKAKDFGSSEKARMLVLGHSRFCKALEAGMRFVDTMDEKIHPTAKKYLESAASYYVRAGFQEASEYAKATGLLFDAYLHINSAKEQPDPEKKTRLYMMAEKVLQTSAGSFMKAKHPEKREQVLRILEKVREERELAMSLTEVLHSPSIMSTTRAVAPPVPTQEEAVGLERFAKADVQADITVTPKELTVNESISVDIDLVNAGKGPATLVKISEAIPEGFKVAEKTEKYRIEDSYINMKGKRLDSLKTDEVKLVLKATNQGAFQLKPKILYLDENGKYKTYKAEPIDITVKELGIKGWLKGTR